MARVSEGAWYRKAKDTWYATVGGRKVSLGVKGKENRKAAQEAWHKLMAGGRREVTPSGSPLTVAKLTDSFLADVRTRAKPKTADVYAYLFQTLTSKFGTRQAEGLKPHDVETAARKPSWSASTRNDFLAAVVTAFRWAVRAGLLSADPLAGVRKPPKASRGAKAVLTADQCGKLREAAPAALKPFLTGLWLTGCRPGELARLTAADVDLANGVAVLAEHKTADATGRPRLVFLSAEAVALFRSQADKNPSGPLFRNSRGGAWTGWAVVKAVEAARERAGLPHATAYGFRHTFATDALVNGLSDAHVAGLMGHASTAMLHKHYSHLTSHARAMREALAKVR